MFNKKRLSRFAVTLVIFSLIAALSSCKKAPDKQQQAKPEPTTESNTKTEQNTAPVANDKMVPIHIKLPKAVFEGTPTNLRGVTNLEKPLGKARPPFLAPVGTVNLALGKPISCSDEEPIIGEVSYITDGNKEATDGSFVEFFSGAHTATIDLGVESEIWAILIWHYHKQARVYFDVVAQTSNDPDFIEATTHFNNDTDNSLGLGVGTDKNYVETSEGKLINAGGTKARYVRLHCNGSSNNELNHYIEIEVYGRPVK